MKKTTGKPARIITSELSRVIGGVDTLDGGDYSYDGSDTTTDATLKDLRDTITNVDKIRSFDTRK